MRCARVDPERGTERRNRGVGLLLKVVYPREVSGSTIDGRMP